MPTHTTDQAPTTALSLWLATASTGHYEWSGVGQTEHAAVAAMHAGYAAHAALTGADPDLLDRLTQAGEGDVRRLTVGVGYRDGERVTPDVIYAPEVDWWRCPCGNEPDAWGFYACGPDGKWWRPAGAVTGYLRCANPDCGRVGAELRRDPDTGTVPVVARNTDRTAPWGV